MISVSRNPHLFLILFFLCQLMPAQVFTQTIQEKINSLEESPWSELDSQTLTSIDEVNRQLAEQRTSLAFLYSQIAVLHSSQADCKSYRQLLQQINATKQSIRLIEEEWRTRSMDICPDGNFALWHQPDTTLEQLIIDYGSQNYVYLIPPEVSKMKVSVDSHLPIPKESWNEMIELILANSGLGVKQLNPFLRQIYLLNKEPLGLSAIMNKREELYLYPEHARICFALITNSQDPAGVHQFLNRFTHNSERLKIHLIGRTFFILGQAQEIKELLSLYDFIEQGEENKEYKLVPIWRLESEEMERILKAYFYHSADKSMPGSSGHNSADLRIIALKMTTQALFLIGSREQICRAERIICDIQEQLEDPKEKTIFWYTCKHAQANEVAEVLSRIYRLMTNNPCIAECQPPCAPTVVNETVTENNNNTCGPYFGPIGPPLVVNPDPVIPVPYCAEAPGPGPCENFIVDEKSGAIIMVIEVEFLPKIRELVKRLDQPAKMVQIEVLLFEKKIEDESNFGLNLLKIGAKASNTHQTSLLWNDPSHFAPHHGILSFFLSRMRGGGLPAFDLIYNFMLTQDNFQINACPSVTTVNQTCAKIALVEEISISNGVVQFDCYNNGALRESFTRAQYGITIEITPTIHIPDECDLDPCEDPTRYVTLDTNITFDSPKPSLHASRPDVLRRNIINQVRVPDGQTVIIGGLRKKTTHDCAEKIPFLGEIPGIGKLFSVTKLADKQTEMFIFITPKIISDPVYDFNRIRCEELCKRPGDTPAFLSCVLQARELERERTFAGGMRLLFGQLDGCPEVCSPPFSAYDGY